MTETEICEIVASRSFARDRNGNEYRYRTLIWAADLKTLYRDTDTSGLPNRAVAKIQDRKANLLGRRGGDSVFILFITVDEPPETFAGIEHWHFFYASSRAGMGEINRGDLRRMSQNWDQVSREDVLSWLADFCRLNTYEISIPALRDVDSAPA